MSRKARYIAVIIIIVICAISIGYAVYFQIYKQPAINAKMEEELRKKMEEEKPIVEFDNLFDNKMNYQNNNVNVRKIDQEKELVYNSYNENETVTDKYEIKVNIPAININYSKIDDINNDINRTFRDRINEIKDKANNGGTGNTIYTVEYTAYLNNNILSLVIRATIKEGLNAQKVVIKGYSYNIDTNNEVSLPQILELKNIKQNVAEREIKNAVQEGITRTNNLAELGYSVYERDINNEMYKIENTNNYLLGPNGVLYIIYAYGNDNNTSEKDVAVIK